MKEPQRVGFRVEGLWSILLKGGYIGDCGGLGFRVSLLDRKGRVRGLGP